MKKVIVYILLISFSAAESRPFLYYFDYIINYDYISEVLCINRDEVKPTCNGKCYLSNNLKNLTSKNENSKEEGRTIEWKPSLKLHKLVSGLLIRIPIQTDHLTIWEAKKFYSQFIPSPPTPPPRF